MAEHHTLPLQSLAHSVCDRLIDGQVLKAAALDLQAAPLGPASPLPLALALSRVREAVLLHLLYRDRVGSTLPLLCERASWGLRE